MIGQRGSMELIYERRSIHASMKSQYRSVTDCKLNIGLQPGSFELMTPKLIVTSKYLASGMGLFRVGRRQLKLDKVEMVVDGYLGYEECCYDPYYKKQPSCLIGRYLESKLEKQRKVPSLLEFAAFGVHIQSPEHVYKLVYHAKYLNGEQHLSKVTCDIIENLLVACPLPSLLA